MQLSKRMRCLASLVTEGNRLADVGTDHGYVPIALVREGRIPSAIAMDVNRGPLARAGEHVREFGLSTYIELRLSDGLEKLLPGEADTVLMAGMGGMLMVRLLEEGNHCLDTVEELILQPQSDHHRVREWLSEHGYQVAAEEVVKEDGKYYSVIRAVHGKERRMDPAELCYGKTDVQRSPGMLCEYLREELARDQKILEILRKSGREDTERAQEIRYRTARIGWMLSRAESRASGAGDGRRCDVRFM